MYPVSATFKDYITRNTVDFSWYGTITDINSNTYDITDSNMAQGSGRITKRCGVDSLKIGTTCASELQLNLYLDIDRYVLFGGTIEIGFTLQEGLDANDDPITEDVPMGIFTISESNQSNGQLSIIAYDGMTKFDDTPFVVNENIDVLLPYEWLSIACTACGVTLGMTSVEVKALPNGDRKTGFADAVTDVESWRDVLGYLGEYLGSFSYIGRDGKLYLTPYKSTSLDTIPASFRFTSNLSDFRTTYDGLYAIHKESGMQEYVGNSNSGGLILDLGVNPFLQFEDADNRQAALKEIIDAWNGIYYVPFDSEIPIMPHYDIGDVVTFTDNQAGEYDVAAITEIVCSFSGKSSISCCGDNPRLAAAQDRFTKSVEGLNSDYSNGQESGGKNFWLLETENKIPMTVSSTKTMLHQIDWVQKVDVQRMGFMFTCEASSTVTETVTILITVDDNEIYEFEVTEEKLLKGKRILSANCGFRVTGKGDHFAKVYMTVVDTPLKWSDLV